MTMQTPAGLPFRLGTRRIVEHVATKTLTLGGARIDVDLKRVGYLAGVLIRVKGTVTATGDPAPLPGHPYNVLKRVTLDTPGLNNPISPSGYQLHLQNLLGRDFVIDRHGGSREDAQAGTATADANAYHDAHLVDLYPTATATNTWELSYYLPAQRNARDLRGIIPLGNTGTTTIELTPAALADLFGTTANVSASSLTAEIYQVYWTAPPNGVAAPDTSSAIVFDEYVQPISATGRQSVDIKRDGVILNVVHAVWLDDDAFPAAPEDDIESVTLRVNRDKWFDAVPYWAFAKVAAMERDIVLPAGVIAYDLDAAAADIPYADPLDPRHARTPGWLYSDGVTEIESSFVVASDATLDNAKVVTSVKRLMPVAS